MFFYPCCVFFVSGDVVTADFAALLCITAGAGGERSGEEEVGQDPGGSAEHPDQEPAEEPSGPHPARGLRCLATDHQDNPVRRCAR